MTELTSPETYISLHGYREILSSSCEIEILEGTLRYPMYKWAIFYAW